MFELLWWLIAKLRNELQHLLYLLVEGEGAVDPMDGYSVALHTAEPGHLAFGKAADVGEKVGEHLVVGTLGGEVEGEVLVFEAVAEQPLHRCAGVEELPHFFDHALLEALSQTQFYTSDYLGAFEEWRHHGMGHLWHLGEAVGMGKAVFGNLECTDEACPVFGVGVVVEVY